MVPAPTLADGVLDLGYVIGERVIEFCDPEGRSRRVTVRLGAPVRLPEGDYRCPFQLLGLGDDRVRAPWGEDSFIALEYAIQMIGQILDHSLDRLQLRLPASRDNSVAALHFPYASTWVFRYPAC